MKKLTRSMIFPVLLLVLAGPAAAQTADDYHPFLSDKFNLGLGAFWPAVNVDLRVDGSVPEEEIDFDEILNLNDNNTTPWINFRWRFGEKWSVLGQAWTISSDKKAVLEEDVSWEDVIFREGTFVAGGAGLDVVRVFFGRKFDLAPQHEFGIGLGFHWMNLDSYLEGEVLINDGSTDFYRGEASAAFPLPNLGAWYMYSWSPKWVFMTHVDWLSASIGDYSGGLWDIELGINYQPFEHVGFGLSYKSFLLDVDVDKNDWRGAVKYDQSGPTLAVTFTWGQTVRRVGSSATHASHRV